MKVAKQSDISPYAFYLICWATLLLSVSTQAREPDDFNLFYQESTHAKKEDPGQGEGSTVKDIDFYNWGFENGLKGWTKKGEAFDSQPTFGDNVLSDRVLVNMNYDKGGIGGNYWKEMAFPIGHKGNYWIGTYENHPLASAKLGQANGNTPVGYLLSSAFIITKPYCDFLLGGNSGSAYLSVELKIKGTDGKWSTVLKASPAINSDKLYRQVFDLRSLKGKTAQIAIIDNTSSGHINVDDFRFFDNIPGYLKFGDLLMDEDAPVWGFADTHAHPTSQEGFGGRTLIGDPAAPLNQTYSGDLCTALHLANPFVAVADPHLIGSGYPDFIGFPRFNSKTHQQQHIDFLKRAWEGGLRLYCALAVNNMYIPTRTFGPGNDGRPLDDESVMFRELDLMKKIAASQGSWMEIAYSPQEARRIIHQGKLAVVLGVEADNFGNFKSPSYVWKDHSRDKELVVLTTDKADAQLDAKLNEYYRYGIRQITPIHYISGVFGGATVFRAETSMIQFDFNDKVKVKGGVSRKVGYHLLEDWNYMAGVVGGGYFTSAQVASHIEIVDHEANICMVNAEGLTDIGKSLMTKMMKRGLLIDSEHMSYESKDDLFGLAKTNENYPVMSSHTDPHGLSFNWTGTPRRFSGSVQDKLKYFGTSTIRNIAQEGQLLNEHYQRIKELGGTVGVLLLPFRKQDYKGRWGAVLNDCAGSSKTWAQMYLHSLDQLNGKGVGLSSDRGFVDFIAPRFGPYAAFSMQEEVDEYLKTHYRTLQRYNQKNGVLYDRTSSSFHPKLFEFGGSGVERWEEDAWKALAAWEAGAQEGQISRSSDRFHRGRIQNFVKGLYAKNQSQLSKWYFGSGDLAWEQSAMYCLKNNITPDKLTIHDASGIAKTTRIYLNLLPVWNLWKAKNGNNPQLRRYLTGTRDWDFNLDGLAHYGLIPDFLQDLRNIGLTPQQLTPLFRSAEDYIQMWEKADKYRIKR